MTLDKEDIATAKEMAKRLQASKAEELVVVGNLLAVLLKEHEAPQRKPWVSLSDVQWMNIVNKNHAWHGYDIDDAVNEVRKLTEAKLRELNA